MQVKGFCWQSSTAMQHPADYRFVGTIKNHDDGKKVDWK